MTREENDIMRDVYYYLRDHNDPPGPKDEAAGAFWKKAAGDARDLASGTWKNHPLVLELLAGVYRYLEAKGGGGT